MPQKTPAEGATDGLLASPCRGGQNFRKNVAMFSGTRKGDIDLDDHSCSNMCLTGPGVLPEPGCEAANLDADDADMADFVTYSSGFTALR